MGNLITWAFEPCLGFANTPTFYFLVETAGIRYISFDVVWKELHPRKENDSEPTEHSKQCAALTVQNIARHSKRKHITSIVYLW